MIRDKILVGHALKNDLEVLLLSHPRSMIRDTAYYRPYMRVNSKPLFLKSKYMPLCLCSLLSLAPSYSSSVLFISLSCHHVASRQEGRKDETSRVEGHSQAIPEHRHSDWRARSGACSKASSPTVVFLSTDDENRY